MEESNFLDFCKHGRKQTCYTEAAEVLRWQTRAAWQKRRRSCQTSCNKTKIHLKMENADIVSSMPSAEKSLSHFHCHAMPPRSLMITLVISDFLHCQNHIFPEWPAPVKQELYFPTRERQNFWLFQARRATSLAIQRHWSCEKSLNNSSPWRSARPNSSSNSSPGEPLNRDRLQPGSRQDQKERILVTSCYWSLESFW